MAADNHKSLHTLGERLLASGWRQGGVFPESAHHKIQAEFNRLGRTDIGLLGTEDRVIVVGQTCDLVCPHDHLERYTEVAIARMRPGKAQSALVGRKSSRLLHLPLPDSRHLEMDVQERCFIERNLLDESPPDQGRALAGSGTTDVIEWLLQRYKRTAFPNNFEKRLVSKQKEIDAALADCRDVREIRLAIKPSLVQELGDDEPYTEVVPRSWTVFRDS